MKNKKLVIIFIVIVIIAGVLAGIYKIMTSYIFNTKDMKIEHEEEKLVERLKSTKEYEIKEEQVKLFLEAGEITEEEAKEILKVQE